METYTVSLNGLEIHASIGVTEAEREVGHRLRINLAFEVQGAAPITDELAETVDYGAAANAALVYLSNHSHQTLERLASGIAADLLDRFSQAISVKVEVLKIAPPIGLIAESAGVTIERKRYNCG